MKLGYCYTRQDDILPHEAHDDLLSLLPVCFQMSKFSQASSVPETFIDKQITLNGKLRNVEPSGILNIAHTPAVSSSWFRRKYGRLAVCT